MGIENISERIVLVNLPELPHLSSELETVTAMVSDKPVCDVIIEFSEVEMLTSESICSLMILARLLAGQGHRLIFCKVPSDIRQIFSRTGLEKIFEFAADRYAILESAQHTH